MKKKTRNGWLALLLMVSVVFADMMPSLALTVQAAQEESALQGMADGTSVTAETSGGEVEGTQEKQLVQYSNDWTILRYMDDTGEPKFDIYYKGKSYNELRADHLNMEYQIIHTDYNYLEFHTSGWYRITDDLSEEEVDFINQHKNDCFVQFSVVNPNGFGSTYVVSNSDMMSIYPQENPYPYILSSSYDFFNKEYYLSENPNSFKVTLKLSEQLKQINETSILIASNRDNYLSDYFANNLRFQNCSEEYTINNKTYEIKYSLLSFDVSLSPVFYNSDTSGMFFVYYVLKFNGITGVMSNNEVSNLLMQTTYPATKPISNVQTITINAPSSTVKPGNTITLTPNVLPEDAEDKSVTWSSSNLAYATVDANGVVTANAAGAGKSVVITATANDGSGVSGTYTLYIETIPVTGITIKGSATNVTAGDKVNLSATVAPSNATNSGITWSSSNTAYATVDANGVVTTKAAGAGKSVVITATANDGSGVKSTFNINIKKVNVTKISLSTTTKTVQAGKKATVKAAIAPTNATNKAITWTSSNTKFATVNSKGVVTTKKAGIGKTVTITAKAKDGSGKKSSIKIKIVKTVKVSKIKLTTSSKTVKAGKKVTVKAAITPVNATNKKVTWTSSNKDYATVNSKGVVTTKKAGKGKTVTITAKAKDGSGKKAAVKIKIK